MELIGRNVNLDFGYFVEVKVIRKSVEMSCFACKIQSCLIIFFLAKHSDSDLEFIMEWISK